MSENIWICPHCGHPYNQLSIEYKLVQLLDQLIYKYNNQDLRCKKCKNAKEDLLRNSCSCNGDFINSDISSLKYEEMYLLYIYNRLKPLENIANYHDLKWLKETINTYKLSEINIS